MPGMKQHTIKLVIRKKVDNWLDTITDETLRYKARKNTIVTGGAIASMLLGEKPNDYDIYFRDFDTAMEMAVYYTNVFNSRVTLNSINNYGAKVKVEAVQNIKGDFENRIIIFMQSAGVAGEEQASYKYFEGEIPSLTDDFTDSLKRDPEALIDDVVKTLAVKEPYRPVFLTDNALTLANKVQLIIRFYGEPNVIHKNFDFAHATCYYDYDKSHLELPQEALESLLSKDLIYSGSLYPLASFFRVRKFLQRGWRISAGQMLKIAWQVNELNLKDPKVLREQLIGVDQAYMHQLMSMLNATTPGTRIDSAYIASLIDKIWD
jgi:hypothetical protein